MFFSPANIVPLAYALKLPVWLVPTLATTRNWTDIALYMYGVRKQFDAKFKDGEELRGVCKDNFWIYKNKRLIKWRGIDAIQDHDVLHFNFRGREMMLGGKAAAYTLEDAFIAQPYKKLNVAGKTVVDVGANVGDTAIYFMRQGAAGVIAIEPYANSYNQAKKNIELNGQKKIKLVKAAVGSKRGSIILDPSIESTSASSLIASEKGERVPIVTVQDILRKYRVKKPILKMDVEGFEYEILLNTEDAILSRFDEIILEYHYGHRNLCEKLHSAGFDVKLLGKPMIGYSKQAKDKIMVGGIIYAKRKKR